jgi:hypothetical protein
MGRFSAVGRTASAVVDLPPAVVSFLAFDYDKCRNEGDV